VKWQRIVAIFSFASPDEEHPMKANRTMGKFIAR
jgi:hypothetical protein